MKWEVYHYNINRDKIETWNIFEHYSFRQYAKKAARKHLIREDFEEQLKSELHYYFWAKSEYELVIEITDDNKIFLIPWCGCKEPEKTKIEIFPILTEDGFNWIEFAKEHIVNQKYYNKAKIDIYDQVMFDWNKFADYCWKNKSKLLKMDY